MEKSVNNNSRTILGLLMVLIGGTWLLRNLGYLPYQLEDILFRWPMILVLIGVFRLVKRDYTSAVITLGAGIFFMLPNLYHGFSYRDVFTYWPLLIIAAGLVFFLKKRSTPDVRFEKSDRQDIIDEVDVFGGGVTQVDSQNFKGGKITAIFGGGELSLERCRMSDQGAVIDVAIIFGGTKITIPRDWNVKVEVASVFGGFTDKRHHFGDITYDPSKTLIIKGSTIFGGGELRSI